MDKLFFFLKKKSILKTKLIKLICPKTQITNANIIVLLCTKFLYEAILEDDMKMLMQWPKN